MERDGLPRGLLDWLPELLFLTATTAAGLWARGRWVTPMADPGSWWSLAHRLSEGERLYREVFALQHGPLSPYLLALGAAVFGAGARYFLLVNWIAGILAGLVWLRVARVFCVPLERVALAGLLIGTSILAPGPGRLVYAYAPGTVHAFLFSSAAFWVLFGSKSPATRRVLGAGVICGIAFLSKQEIGLAAFLSVCLYSLISKRPGWLLRTIAGFCFVMIPASLWLVASANLNSLVRFSRVWPLVLRPPGERASHFTTAGLTPEGAMVFSNSAWGLLYLLAVLAALSLLGSGERDRRRSLPLAALTALLAVWWVADGFQPKIPFTPIALSWAVALVVLVASLLDARMERRSATACIAAFAVLTGGRTLISPETGGHYSGAGHFATSLTWILFFSMITPRLLLPGENVRRYARFFVRAALPVIGWSAALVGIVSLSPPGVGPVVTPGGVVFLDLKHEAFFRLLGRELRRGERALVVPEINAVDALFGVRSASPFPLHHPSWLEGGGESELIARLERAPPDVVVIFDRPTAEWRVAPFGRGYGFALSRWIARRYETIGSNRGGVILRPKSSGGNAPSIILRR